MVWVCAHANRQWGLAGDVTWVCVHANRQWGLAGDVTDD